MSHAAAKAPESDPERLVFISDGVFSVAMTLAAVELVPGDLHERLAAEGTWRVLRSMEARFIAVAVTFMIVAIYWRAHQRMFSRVARVDGRMTSLNLYFLLAVTLMPFAVQLTSMARPDAGSTAVYGLLVGSLGLLLNRMWAHAIAAGLLDAGVDAGELRVNHYRTLITAALFIVSAPAACLVGPLWSRLLWGAALLSGRAARRLAGKT